jgi:hypothetical protein
MAFEVETGSGSHTATSFCSVAYADTHHAKDKRTAATWAALSTANKQYRLETATEIICRDSTFAGYPVKLVGNTSGKQRLAFPRSEVYDRDGNAIDSDEIPEDLQRATAQLAGELELEDLDEEPTRGLSSLGVGSIQLVFDKTNEAKPILRSVFNYLKPYLAMSGAFGKAVR